MSKLVNGYFIDVQGTLIDDINKMPVNGACEFIDFLNENSIPYVVITNNTKEKSDLFLDDLKQKGLNIKNYIDPFFILKDIVKSKKLAAFRTDDLIAMHGTSTYSKDSKRYPGVGAIMSMIKFAVNKDYKVVGKPSLEFFEKARALINLEFKDITIISDDMIGDLLGAANLQMKICLVLSGKVKSKKELLGTLSNDKIPKNICKDMSEVLELLKKGEV